MNEFRRTWVKSRRVRAHLTQVTRLGRMKFDSPFPRKRTIVPKILLLYVQRRFHGKSHPLGFFRTIERNRYPSAWKLADSRPRAYTTELPGRFSRKRPYLHLRTRDQPLSACTTISGTPSMSTVRIVNIYV